MLVLDAQGPAQLPLRVALRDLVRAQAQMVSLPELPRVTVGKQEVDRLHTAAPCRVVDGHVAQLVSRC